MSNAPQPGIFADDRRCHYFLEYKLDASANARAAAADIATARNGVRILKDAPELVVAFGSSFWTALSRDPVPADLKDFQTLQGVKGHVAVIHYMF